MLGFGQQPVRRCCVPERVGHFNQCTDSLVAQPMARHGLGDDGQINRLCFRQPMQSHQTRPRRVVVEQRDGLRHFQRLRKLHAALRVSLANYLEVSAGRLPPMHMQIFPQIAQRVVAALYAHGLGNDTLATDVRTQSLTPPDTRPVSWPWVLRVRLFDGFSCDGLAAPAPENNKKADSKTTQILQYLAAHTPAAVSAQRLADALWPEAEGDKAMRSLDVALTRLRQSLPDAALLTRHDGKIGFDLDRVWCDTHAVLAQVERLRDFANAAGGQGSQNKAAVGEAATADTLARDTAQARTALALLALYRGPLLPDSREAFARDRAAFFRSQAAGAVQIGLRAAIRLPDQTMAEEIVRKSVSHGLPADVVRSVIADMQARGEDTSRRAAQLSNVFDLARA